MHPRPVIPLVLACLIAACIPPDAADLAPAERPRDPTPAPEPWVNPDAAADAFRLLYQERVARIALSYNRFSLVGDVVPAQTLNTTYVARAGDRWEVFAHATDNNPPGLSTFNAMQALRVFGGRDLALTVIRQLEGMRVEERISNHPGLTVREWEPGWTMTLEGATGAITRTHAGGPVASAEPFPDALEQEISRRFYDGVHFTYHLDPEEDDFRISPILSPGIYGTTYVFQHLPDYLFVSNCCSSFMITPEGDYAGYLWGNHNSRDNFPDIAFGYLAGLEASRAAGVDPDVAEAGRRAWEAGQRVGDHVVESGYTLMTVSEFTPYDEEIPSGDVRPYGDPEPPGNLGDLNSCQMSYLARALSTQGLRSPREVVEIPGALPVVYLDRLFQLLGLPQPPITKRCGDLDQAYGPYTWEDLLTLRVGRQTLVELLEAQVFAHPDLFVPLVEDIAGNLWQPQKSANALVYYADLTQGAGGELTEAARATAYHILEIKRATSQMLIDWAMSQPEPDADLLWRANDWLYDASRDAHTFGVGDEAFTLGSYGPGESANQRFEAELTLPDTSLRSMKTSEQLLSDIEAELSGAEPQVKQRYRQAFPTDADAPVKVVDGRYEAIGADGAYHTIPNVSYRRFGSVSLLPEAALCARNPEVLDCRWAKLGCARPDLDASRRVDSADAALLQQRLSAWQGAPCDASNAFCDGADLDRSGAVDASDTAFMGAAQGCWY